MSESFVRASIYRRVITILNHERNRAKGSGKLAKRKRAEVAALIAWLGNDPAFEWERLAEEVRCKAPSPLNMHRVRPEVDRELAVDPSVAVQ